MILDQFRLTDKVAIVTGWARSTRPARPPCSATKSSSRPPRGFRCGASAASSTSQPVRFYLASPAAAWVTGRSIDVDGGADAAPLEFPVPAL
jgi:hypothetical protein